jgi:hypothetical protein
MDERYGGSIAGAKSFKSGPRPGVPKDVQVSFLLWLTAVAAGVFETALAIIEALSGTSGLDTGVIVGVGIRLIIFAAAIYIASRMRLGKNWARFVLAIGLGVIGTLSIVIGPVSWLAEGHPIGEFLASAGPMMLLFASSRIAHLGAVFAAVVFMFLPAANAYFQAARSATKRTLK